MRDVTYFDTLNAKKKWVPEWSEIDFFLAARKLATASKVDANKLVSSSTATRNFFKKKKKGFKKCICNPKIIKVDLSSELVVFLWALKEAVEFSWRVINCSNLKPEQKSKTNFFQKD